MLNIKDKTIFTIILCKKEWKHPETFTLRQNELNDYIYAAARSGGCIAQMR